MIRFILTRLSLIVPTFIGLTVVAFFLIRLVPGDPIETLAGERGISAERHAMLLKEYGLDQPLVVQYGYYVNRLLHGDLGTSIITNAPVWNEFKTLFPATLELAICAMAIALIIGLPAGVFAAVKRNTVVDQGVMGAALIGYSMPIFWWGLLLIMLFSNTLGWTPVSGRISALYYFEPVTGFMLIDSWLSGEEGAFASAASHLILPAIVLSTIPLAVIARMTRSSMLEVLGEDYIRTARAKGLPTSRVIAIHALRNALIPVVTVIGLQIGVLMTGAILTEYVFSWPGIGTWTLKAIERRDYPVLQGGILAIGSVVMLINLLVDLTYGLINPRIRSSR